MMAYQKMKGRKVSSMIMMFIFQVLFAGLHGCFAAHTEVQPPSKRNTVHQTVINALGSSIFLHVSGNVYPLGYYSVTVEIGSPPKPFELDIDTGSDLTWVQCDAPCKGCTLPRDRLYKPKNNFLLCKDTVCAALHTPEAHRCRNPNEKCYFQVDYADLGSVAGAMVSDNFPSRLVNRSLVSPPLAFGCGYNLKNPGQHAGVLGLSRSKASISSQLSGMAIIKNVVGHCFSGQGGFLVLGADLVPKSGMNWMPMLQTSSDKDYSSMPAELLFGGMSTAAKDFTVIFDSGSTYTYFSSPIYQIFLDLTRKYLTGKPVKEVKDGALPICWKGPRAFKSVLEARIFFNTFALSFAGGSNIQLQLPPEAYLIVTKSGNVCLGILNGTEAGLGASNVIGDISMQDKLMMFDNENLRIGWASEDCTRKPPRTVNLFSGNPQPETYMQN